MYREGCSTECSVFPSKHEECSGIGSLDQDGSQLLCQCGCHVVRVERKCSTCGGKGKVYAEEHDYPRRGKRGVSSQSHGA